MATTDAPSTLLRDELFESESPDFVEYLRQFTGSKSLAAFVDRWKKDTRPWAREQVRAYALLPLDRPGHEVVVKRLFKAAEDAGDYEAIGWWTVAFDRLVRRRRVKRWFWDQSSRSYTHYESLASRRDRLTPNPSNSDTYRRNKPWDRLFSHATRHYLRRRAWRSFRGLGYGQPDAYVAAVVGFLAHYEDADLEHGENLLDSRSLVFACFHGSPLLTFSPRLVNVSENASLGDLTPSPYHAELWKRVDAFSPLVDLVLAARSALVRVFALDLIEADHAQLIPTINKDQLFRLLEHTDPRVAEFAGRAFEANDALGVLGIDAWLELLNRPESPVLAQVAAAFRKHVDPARLDTDAILRLACVRPQPVADLGFELLRARHGQAALLEAQLVALADVQCAALAPETTAWAFLERYGKGGAHSVDFETPFFDAMLRPVRDAAMATLVKGSPGWNEPLLWTRLIESPYPDVRFGLIDRLRERGGAPGAETSRLAPVWTAVVLGVHSGSRWKPKALGQIVDAILSAPGAPNVEGLLAVLALAVRSIRLPERRAGLAAVAELLERGPALEARVQAQLPELELQDGAA